MMLPLIFAATVTLNPLDMRWTFGAHEGYTMYRRVGRHCTGGIDGNAKWVKPWLDWWDENAPAAMQEMGFNWCHSRFYKGMGWAEESKDFPNVQKFVRNCRLHGVHALAYVQYATFYPEIMRAEIPEVDGWAKIREDGSPQWYQNNPIQYFRYEPCINEPAWREYTKGLLKIALVEGGFDGIMFDNCFSPPCYCERCEKLFHAYLESLPNKQSRFGFSSVAGMRQPRLRRTLKGDVQDPVVQAWINWRIDRHTAVLREFADCIHSVKPDAIVSGNPHPYRMNPLSLAEHDSLDMLEADAAFDLIVMQTGNFPGLKAQGSIGNRVRDMKMAQLRGKVCVHLCDNDSRETPETERRYELVLMEDAVFGGVPTDRTSMNPAREPGFLPNARRARRKPVLDRFNRLLAEKRAAFAAPSYQPIKLFYPASAIRFSEQCHLGLVAAEEILLRHRLPWGYAISRADAGFTAPPDCELLILPNTLCLSDREIAGVLAYAKAGGRLIVTGEAGRYDEFVAERFTSPLMDELKRLALSNVVLRAQADLLPVADLGWTYRIASPKDDGRALLADIAATGWKLPVALPPLPPHVFAEFKRDGRHIYVHLVNYCPEQPVGDLVYHKLLEFERP